MNEILAEVSKFLSQPLNLLIDGKWTESLDGDTFDTHDPGDGTVIAKVAAGDQSDIELAVTAAQQAFRKSGWATLPPNDRAVFLHRLADLVDKNREILAQIESLDVGKPLAPAPAAALPNVSHTLRYYADLSVHTRRREPIAVSAFDPRMFRSPYGRCGFIFPCNFPLLLVGWGLSPALAAANTVLIKPAAATPPSPLRFW